MAQRSAPLGGQRSVRIQSHRHGNQVWVEDSRQTSHIPGTLSHVRVSRSTFVLKKNQSEALPFIAPPPNHQQHQRNDTVSESRLSVSLSQLLWQLLRMNLLAGRLAPNQPEFWGRSREDDPSNQTSDSAPVGTSGRYRFIRSDSLLSSFLTALVSRKDSQSGAKSLC